VATDVDLESTCLRFPHFPGRRRVPLSVPPVHPVLAFANEVAIGRVRRVDEKAGWFADVESPEFDDVVDGQ
jgi:hypothetical protein